MFKITHGICALFLGVLFTGCTTTQGQDGAVLGGILGGTAGAIIGHQSGDAGEGALIGAGLGAVTGAIIGESQARNSYTTVEHRRVAAPARRVVVYEEVPAPPVRRAGHYEVRLIRTATGETYEERVWVYD